MDKRTVDIEAKDAPAGPGALVVGAFLSVAATVALAALGYYGTLSGFLTDSVTHGIWLASFAAILPMILIFDASRFALWLACTPVIMFNLASALATIVLLP